MNFRTEHDSMGEMLVPADRYWGAQTQRSLENFPIGQEKMPVEIVHAFGIMKLAAARVNARLAPARMTAEKLAALESAALEVIRGELDDHFPLVVWQTGSGTQSTMNVNEVIAGRANEAAGKKLLHPNDDVNMSQSSNDTFPTAMHIAAILETEQALMPAVENLCATLRRLEEENLLSSLPDELSAAARLRLEYPEASLAHLAAMSVPPITKSGMNHRLQ